MKDLRTKKALEKYIKHLKNNKEDGCPFCNREGLKTFKYWKVIYNRFPYDRIAKEHHLLVPLRHINEDVLTKKELDELKSIKNGFIKDLKYQYILEGVVGYRSQPNHFHLHLIKLK
jgi:hypothetical protein